MIHTIIADDFTGANDTGIQFMDEGVDPIVLVRPREALDDRYINTPVLIIDTESRHLEPDKAYETIVETVKLFERSRAGSILKKIDSTLRGNIGSEIDALMDSLNYQYSFVISAAPENGRVVRDGICYIHNTELHESEFGKDPFAPVDISFIPEIISRQSKRRVGLVTYKDINNSEGHLCNAIKRQLEAGHEILVFDTLQLTDIEKIVKTAHGLKEKILFVGSSGLGKVVNGNKHHKVDSFFNIAQKPLFIIGSLTKLSSAQAERLIQADDSIEIIEVETDKILKSDSSDEMLKTQDIDKAHRKGKCIVLKTRQEENYKESVSVLNNTGKKVSKTLGEITKRAVTDLGVRTLFVTGGETAFNIVKSLNIDSLQLKTEILPGIPLCVTYMAGSEEPLHIITKAGGFGDEQTLVKIMAFIKNDRKMQKDKISS